MKKSPEGSPSRRFRRTLRLFTVFQRRLISTRRPAYQFLGLRNHHHFSVRGLKLSFQ